jgi:voltage-gated potassium channel
MAIRETTPLQDRFYEVIFGTETRAGKWFDLGLIMVILCSVAVILLDSVPGQHERYGPLYRDIEWAFTIFFTVEYLVRIWCSPNRKAYVLSLYGIVDLCALLPTYLSLLLPEAAPLLIIRLLRILRIFRVLRLLTYLHEANTLAGALRRSRRKIMVFFALMMILVTIFGCLLYVIEGPQHGFDTIPESIYWAIVTVTTVGYGDMVPVTALGKAISAVGMLLGYAIIAVPTGIITAELTSEIQSEKASRTNRNCRNCARAGHDPEARYCKHCGAHL